MPFSAIEKYIESLEKRKAELRAILGEAASVPYMDEETRGAWNKNIGDYFEKEKIVEVASHKKMMAVGIKPIFIKRLNSE